MSDIVGGVRLPSITAEFLADMELAFRPPTITAGFDRDTVLWEAAQAAVVEWVKVKATGTKAATDPVAAQLARVRYGS